MAEAVAALSLAANILQVIDGGGKFVATAWNIWNSGCDSVEAFSILQPLAENLKRATKQIRPLGSSKNLGDSLLLESDRGIFDAAEECHKVSQEILDSLAKLGLVARKRDVIKTAFKLLWKDDKIKALQSRLESVRNQLTMHLAASLRLYAMQSLEKQDAILQQLDKLQAQSGDAMQRIAQMDLASRQRGFGSTVVEYLTYRGSVTEAASQEAALREAIMGTIYSQKLRGLGSGSDGPSAFSMKAGRSTSLRNKVLASLHYQGMEDRARIVAEAHESTFHWIFEEPGEEERPWASLRQWLESDNQLYWITGKAGSGKSTLMKFISQPQTSHLPGNSNATAAEPRCMQYLRKWADGKRMAVASFYFWVAGTKMQTSKAGLYRTLLHQILRNQPSIIEQVFPERWEALCLFNEDPKPFTQDEVHGALLRAISLLASTLDTRVCLFIDGLDEFDGNHDDLIKLLTSLVHGIECGAVKICVASRPWVVFEEAFQNQPSLRLEDLTYTDIKDYVTCRFRADRNFTALQKREPAFVDTLIEDIVQKAAGVFLWASLVVTSLLDGMKFGDRVSDLQRRLSQLPPDLEDLYGRILDNLDAFYFEHAAQQFSLIRASPEPPSALLFSFADEDNPEFSIKLPRDGVWTDEDLEARIDVIERRLNSRSKGLIEIGRGIYGTIHTAHHYDAPQERLFKSSVQYLHRTVKDYVEKPEVKERLRAGIKSPFDPHARLCSASLAVFKVESKYSGLPVKARYVSLCGRVIQCMRQASLVSPENVPTMVKILDHLKELLTDTDGFRSLANLISTAGRIASGQLASSSSDTGHQQHFNEACPLLFLETFSDSFLCLAIKCDVAEYVMERIPQAPMVEDTVVSTPLPNQPSVMKKNKKKKLKDLLRALFCSSYNHVAEKSTAIVPPAVDASPPPPPRNRELDELLAEAVPSAPLNTSLIAFLLEQGASHSAITGTPTSDHAIYARGTSVWTRTLAALVCFFSNPPLDPEREQKYTSILSLILTHGASPGRETIGAAMALVTQYFEITGSLRRAAAAEMLRKTLRRYEQTLRRGTARHCPSSLSLGRESAPPPDLRFLISLKLRPRKQILDARALGGLMDEATTMF